MSGVNNGENSCYIAIDDFGYGGRYQNRWHNSPNKNICATYPHTIEETVLTIALIAAGASFAAVLCIVVDINEIASMSPIQPNPSPDKLETAATGPISSPMRLGQTRKTMLA